MKILIWPSSYLPDIGGLEMMTRNLCRELKNRGHEVLIITGNNTKEILEPYEVDGITVHSFCFVQALCALKLSIVKSIILKIKKIINDFKPDIVHIHGWIEAITFYQARTIHDILTMVTSHGVIEHYDYNTSNAASIWSHAKITTVVSDSVAHSLKKKNFSHDAMYRIYNGIPISKKFISTLREKPKKLLMIGRLSSEKCFDIGFEALKILTEKYPDLFLTLVGGGFLYEELSQKRRALGLENVSHITGFVPHEEIESYIDDADIVLVTSEYESFCLVAVEAAMRGRPVIASGVYGLQEVIEDGVTGILIPPHDSYAVATAIEKLILNPNLASELGCAARKKALREFTVKKMTQSYIDLYYKMLGNEDGIPKKIGERDYSCA